MKKGLADALNTFINAALPVVIMGIVFVSGGSFVNKDLMTAGEVYSFYLIANSAAVIFANLIEYFGSIRGAIGAMERVSDTLGEYEEELHAGEEIRSTNAQLSLSKIRFRYKDKFVLDNLDLPFPKNKTTVIVGTNGAGKSTLFRLLEQFYSIDSGSILLDGKEVSAYSLASWRKFIGYVPQESSLMSGTIRSNLSFGKETPFADAEIDEAFAKLGLDEFAKSLPDGYETEVALGGKNFSGGQRQMIALARAVLYNPEILLLDEATCNLDSRTEGIVSLALKKLMENRTTIIIAHDLKTILGADNAVILDGGRVVYMGDPQEVLGRVDTYRNQVMNTENVNG